MLEMFRKRIFKNTAYSFLGTVGKLIWSDFFLLRQVLSHTGSKFTKKPRMTLNFLILLPPPPEGQNYRCAPRVLVYAIPELELTMLYMLEQHSTLRSTLLVKS